MTFKKITITFMISVLLASCTSDKLQIAEAKKCASDYLDAIKQKDFTKASGFYTSETNEHPESKLDEMKKLDEVFGAIKTIELIDSTEVSGEESNIQLTYKIMHEKLESKEKFLIVKEEGNYKIMEHQVRSGIE